MTLFALPALARAGDLVPDGKLLLTGGVGAVEGEAGGGLAAWSVIAGGATADGVGARATATYARTQDFALTSVGTVVGLFDRLELSYAHHIFDTRDAGAKLGLGEGFAFHQDVVGAKWRVSGNLVYDQDKWTPQIAVGVQYKRADRGDLVKALGAKRQSGVDYYIAATKLLLDKNLLLSATLRATEADQFGLLGFGGDRHDGYSVQGEFSAAYMLSKRLVVGAEVRTKPDNLRFAHERDAGDVFAAYALNKRISFTLAYVDLGPIATFRSQRGVYVSLHAGF